MILKVDSKPRSLMYIVLAGSLFLLAPTPQLGLALRVVLGTELPSYSTQLSELWRVHLVGTDGTVD